MQKISPTPGFYPRTAQPAVSRYTKWAIPAHINKSYNVSLFFYKRQNERTDLKSKVIQFYLFVHFLLLGIPPAVYRPQYCCNGYRLWKDKGHVFVVNKTGNEKQSHLQCLSLLAELTTPHLQKLLTITKSPLKDATVSRLVKRFTTVHGALMLITRHSLQTWTSLILRIQVFRNMMQCQWLVFLGHSSWTHYLLKLKAMNYFKTLKCLTQWHCHAPEHINSMNHLWVILKSYTDSNPDHTCFSAEIRVFMI